MLLDEMICVCTLEYVGYKYGPVGIAIACNVANVPTEVDTLHAVKRTHLGN